jgi:hypothetical protein
MDELSRPFVLNREGASLTFQRVTPSQIVGEYRSSFLLYRKGKLIETLTLMRITGADAIAHCDKFDEKSYKLRDADVLRWVNDPPGRKRAIMLSLQRDKPNAGDAEFDALNLTPAEQMKVAAAVLGLELVSEGEGTNPPNGAAEQKTGSPSAPTHSSAPFAESQNPGSSPLTSTTAA